MLLLTLTLLGTEVMSRADSQLFQQVWLPSSCLVATGPNSKRNRSLCDAGSWFTRSHTGGDP
jgi:hypothetical protein